MPYPLLLIRHALEKSKPRRLPVWHQHRNFRSADVFVASYPCSGRAWLRLLLSGIVTARWVDLATANDLIPKVGAHRHAPPLLPGLGRLIRTHETYRPEYQRAIYLVRDIRDVAVDTFSRENQMGAVDCDFDAFLLDFLRGRVNGHGSWQDHVTSWAESLAAKSGNLLIVRYEDLRQDAEAVLTKIVGFLEIAVAPAEVRAAIERNQRVISIAG